MDIVHKLFELGAIKFGKFRLKSGLESPVYIDLRLIISDPKLLVAIADAMMHRASPTDLVCGVPYTALPLATAASIQNNIPMVFCRKEKKEYGTAQQIEGIFAKNQRCLLLEDVITTGKSVMETLEPLRQAGLLVTEVIVVVDREQGGKAFLESQGLKVHALFSLSEILQKRDHALLS